MIVGIDPNTKCLAMACLSEDLGGDGKPILLSLSTVEAAGKTAEMRLGLLFDLFRDWLDEAVKRDRLIIFCEAAPFVGGSRSFAQMVSVVTAVELACRLAHVMFLPIQNPTWKKEVVGRGNADKDAIKEFLCQSFGLADDWKPPDLYDAYGVAVAGLRRLRLDAK